MVGQSSLKSSLNMALHVGHFVVPKVPFPKLPMTDPQVMHRNTSSFSAVSALGSVVCFMSVSSSFHEVRIVRRDHDPCLRRRRGMPRRNRDFNSSHQPGDQLDEEAAIREGYSFLITETAMPWMRQSLRGISAYFGFSG